MQILKKLGCAAAIALAAGAAHADNIMNNWDFNPAGTGRTGAQNINEYLDVNGNAFIQLTPSGVNSFSFTEYAVFNLSQADSNGRLFPLNFAGGNITATLEARGTGTFNGAFTFTGGTIRMYQNPASGQYGTTTNFYGANVGNLIGKFTVLAGGGGNVDASGNPVSNGQVSIRTGASAGDLAPGYFFAENGIDMSTVNTSSFAFTNANTVGRPDALLVDEVACQFAQFKGPGCNGTAYANVPGGYFFVSNNGQFKFAEVAEPGSVALFGIALFGIGALRRRVK